MQVIKNYCDECGAEVAQTTVLQTGRVLIDGKDHGQAVDLCKEHKPAPGYFWQPTDCKKVSFYWSGAANNGRGPVRGG